MGFLDNSGDIILDAVLTDTGRHRLARGDGSFQVAKFALGDDEIDYNLYDKNHPSGSAYYDIEILQTPVLEAFTNNMSTMKSKLVSISKTNILYLPVIKLNQNALPSSFGPGDLHSSGLHLISVDEDTFNQLAGTTPYPPTGILNGFEVQNSKFHIHFDQGIDSSGSAPTVQIDPDLRETQYILHLDHRLGMISQPNSSQGFAMANYSFLDDDHIATYYLTTGGTGNNSGYVSNIGVAPSQAQAPQSSVLLGRRGTRLSFRIKAAENLANSDFLFDRIGLSTNVPIVNSDGDSHDYRAIDTTIKITGGTTGYSVELPIRFIKKL